MIASKSFCVILDGNFAHHLSLVPYLGKLLTLFHMGFLMYVKHIGGGVKLPLQSIKNDAKNYTKTSSDDVIKFYNFKFRNSFTFIFGATVKKSSVYH